MVLNNRAQIWWTRIVSPLNCWGLKAKTSSTHLSSNIEWQVPQGLSSSFSSNNSSSISFKRPWWATKIKWARWGRNQTAWIRCISIKPECTTCNQKWYKVFLTEICLVKPCNTQTRRVHSIQWWLPRARQTSTQTRIWAAMGSINFSQCLWEVWDQETSEWWAITKCN